MKHCLILISILLTLLSCKDIFETDISKKVPVIILPSQGLVYETNPIHVKWKEMLGAKSYRLEIVSPTFATPSVFAVDSIVLGTEIYFNLDSADYQIRITAENAGYYSKPSGISSFKVGTAQVISNQVSLLAPLDEVYFNSESSIDFNWEVLSEASNYEFTLRQGENFGSSDILVQENGIVTSVFEVDNVLFTEGKYIWAVQAFLNNEPTGFVQREFYVDTTSPNVPVLGEVLQETDDVIFNWTNGIDPGNYNSIVSSEIQIASDPNFTIIEKESQIIGETISFQLSSGNYYWRVGNVDAVGNSTFYSDSELFTVN